jgi:hypothetical protein
MDSQGANQPPFSRQLGIGIHLFGQWCPRCSHPKFANINTIPYKAKPETVAENVTFLNYGICPSCGVTRSELFHTGELNEYVEFAGCLGQRSGKSALFSLLSPYITHHYLKLQNPNKVLGLMQHTTLSATFVGLTFARAVALLWSPVHTLMANSSWFQQYHQLLDYYQEKYGEENLYSFKETFIQYKHRGLYLYPMGPNKRTLRGDSRFQAGIDELGWFFNGGVEDDEAREKASGREVHGALDRSLKTVRMKVRACVKRGMYILTAYLASISSPSHARDMIMTLVNTHSDSSDVLAVHLPTWKFNPDYSGREDFSKEYKEDWARAERDFGAQPSINTNPYISEEDEPLLLKCFAGVNRIRYEYKTWEKPHSRLDYKSIRIVNTVAAPQEVGSVMLLDAGYSNNSFSISVGKRNGKIPVFDVIAECAPVKGEEVINFNDIYKLLSSLITEFNVKVIISDRWNSIKILQDLEAEHGVEIIHYTLKFADFVNAKSYLLNDTPAVMFPKLDMEKADIRSHTENYPHVFALRPVSHLYFQFLTVKQMGKVVEKGDGLTDDLFRTIILGITFLIDLEFCEKLHHTARGKGGIATSSIGISGMRSESSNFAVVATRRGIR